MVGHTVGLWAWGLVCCALTAGCGSSSDNGSPGGGGSGTGGFGGSGAGPSCADGDADHDGTCASFDCNDLDPSINPKAQEVWIEGPPIPLQGHVAAMSLQDVAIGPGDVMYMVYQSDNLLRIAKLEQGVWTTESLTTGPAGNARLTIDSEGYLHIAYEDLSGASVIYYATNRTGKMVHTPVGAGNGEATSPDIALDGAGTPHLLYTQYILRHAWIDTQGVHLEDFNNGYIGELAADSSGAILAAWDDGPIYTSTLGPSGWSAGGSIPANNDDGILIDYAIDGLGRQHTLWTFQEYGAPLSVGYAVSGPGGLEDTRIDLPSQNWPRLFKAPDGVVHRFAQILSGSTAYGFSHVFEQGGTFHQVTYYGQQKEYMGLLAVDSQNRLHRFESTGRYTYSDGIDSNCDGLD